MSSGQASEVTPVVTCEFDQYHKYEFTSKQVKSNAKQVFTILIQNNYVETLLHKVRLTFKRTTKILQNVFPPAIGHHSDHLTRRV